MNENENSNVENMNNKDENKYDEDVYKRQIQDHFQYHLRHSLLQQSLLLCFVLES